MVPTILDFGVVPKRQVRGALHGCHLLVVLGRDQIDERIPYKIRLANEVFTSDVTSHGVSVQRPRAQLRTTARREAACGPFGRTRSFGNGSVPARVRRDATPRLFVCCSPELDSI